MAERLIPHNAGRWALWSFYALLLIAAPLLLNSRLSLTLLSQAAYLIIICLSYNILLGQGGMLSFGHAVYAGIGSFGAVHAMNGAAQGGFYVPLPLIPLVGGLAGLCLAALLGYVSTRKAGTTFAMMTLGVGELVAALALMLPTVFGGEGGISTNRVYGAAWWGLTFGPQIQVYYLIAAYCFVCTAAMFALTRTPLGRLLNAVRDNPERAEFIGCNPQRVRYQAFLLAGFFAGIGGALAAIHSEIVTVEVLGSARSGSLLLFTFLGGSAFFFGPIIGAVLMVLALGGLSALTSAWLLYVGLMFLLMVMYAPGGLASLLVMNLRLAAAGKLQFLGAAYLALLAAALPALTGTAALVEMLYRLQLDATLGMTLDFIGMPLNADQPAAWLGAGLLGLTGWALFALARRRFLEQWRQLHAEIESESAAQTGADADADAETVILHRNLP
ncbi:MAG: branched-chain amino acid ABC transporter permease [Polaromonas sp.]|nr:branched-chain amino acid ABC transporter permease [Polaromonas sp.]